MKISVVIPSFNRAHVIKSAIESILAQSYPVDEVLVIDDGSADDTRSIVEAYGDSVKYVYQANAGASAARNHGISIASNEWVAFLDSDDRWSRDKLLLQVNAIKQTGALCCLGAHEDDSGTFFTHDPQLQKGSVKLYADGVSLVVAHNRHPLLQSLLIHTSLIKKIGLLDQTLRVAEDTKFIFRLTYFNPVVYVNSALFELTRTRAYQGLSDEKSIEKAILRYECYYRVQLEVYGFLVLRASPYTGIVRKNIGYFLSRLAELYAVNQQVEVSKVVAHQSLHYWSGLKPFIRALVCIVSPSYFGRSLKKTKYKQL